MLARNMHSFMMSHKKMIYFKFQSVAFSCNMKQGSSAEGGGANIGKCSQSVISHKSDVTLHLD